jgi:hypothetical protein
MISISAGKDISNLLLLSHFGASVNEKKLTDCDRCVGVSYGRIFAVLYQQQYLFYIYFYIVYIRAMMGNIWTHIKRGQ